MRIDFDFACQDDCLDKMVPSDLRALISERDRLKDDQRLSEDPLTALASVMRHHRLAIGISNGRPKIYGDHFTFESHSEILTADDIKPENNND